MKKIKLGGKNKNIFVLVDNEDFENMARYSWYLHAGGYARNRSIGYMHRLLLHTPKGFETDHVNGNGLDNRKENLRVVTRSQNRWNTFHNKRNTSGYKGAFFHKVTGKWAASIRIFGKTRNLGFFNTKEDAASAYNQAAEKYFGEFARLNKIQKLI